MSSKPGGFAGPSAERKSRRNPAASPGFGRLKIGARLEPLGAATIHAGPAIPIVTMVPIAIAAIHHAPVPPASTAEAAFHMRQEGEPALLAVIEGLGERSSRVRDTLHRRSHRRHRVGALAHARHWIVGVPRIMLLSSHARSGT